MKINHIISSIDVSTGGPARSVTHLIHNMLKEDATISIELNTIKTSEPIVSSFLDHKARLKFDSSKTGKFSKATKINLSISETDLFHGHGLWQMPVHQMSRIARKRNLPYIITPRGMLEPWSLSQRRLKKQLALKIFQEKDLRLASCIHATAKLEADNIRRLGYKNPIATIPNGINLNEFPLYEKKVKAKSKLLFLSRIHPKKGIELLIEAWHEIDSNLTREWIVEIVGNGDPDYIRGLNNLIKDFELEQVIKISGPCFGDAKRKKYQEAELFVLPSYSENFGIVIAEALASKIPVITTKGTPWEDLNSFKCGEWIDIGKEPLKVALLKMLSKPQAELRNMGANGRLLIEKKYAMSAVAQKMLDLYRWILSKGKKPEFVDSYE